VTLEPANDAASAPRPVINSGRDDYDQLFKAQHLKPGESTFVIRAQDSVSADAVRAYASLLYRACDEKTLPSRIPLIESALQQADRLDAWAEKKLPDADHLKPDQAQQLTYHFGRRAWSAAPDCADLRMMFAEERALATAFSRLRPLLKQLFERLTPNDDGSFTYEPLRTKDGLPIQDHCPIIALQRFVASLGRVLPPVERPDVARQARDLSGLVATAPRHPIPHWTFLSDDKAAVIEAAATTLAQLAQERDPAASGEAHGR
jgi:hypothetical protein